jgi:hypothetical protein
MEQVYEGLIEIIERYGKYHPQQHINQDQMAIEFNIKSKAALRSTLSRWKNPRHFSPALAYVDAGSEHVYIWKDVVEFRDNHLRKRKRGV